jgi:hypothetical protein
LFVALLASLAIALAVPLVFWGLGLLLASLDVFPQDNLYDPSTSIWLCFLVFDALMVWVTLRFGLSRFERADL